jgi:hypothetical protein
MTPKKINFSEIPEFSDKQLSRRRTRLSEIGDALEKISRGDASCRQGRTKTVSPLSALAR